MSSVVGYKGSGAACLSEGYWLICILNLSGVHPSIILSLVQMDHTAAAQSHVETQSEDEESDQEILSACRNAPHGYDFEPVIVAGLQLSEPSDESTDQEEEEEEDGERLQHVAWCQCGNCSVETLISAVECVCCLEIPAILHRIQLNEQATDLRCITDNPHFFTVCLDVEVLEVAVLSMADVKADAIVRPIPSW